MTEINFYTIHELESIIRQNSDITISVNRFGDFSVSKDLELTKGEIDKGWNSKRQTLEMLFYYDPPEHNSLIMTCSISNSSNTKAGLVESAQYRFAYSQEKNGYTELEMVPQREEMEKLINLGFNPDDIRSLLDIGGNKLIAAMAHPRKMRIWDIADIDYKFIQDFNGKIDPMNGDVESLIDAGHNPKIIEQLFSTNSLSPRSQYELLKHWLAGVCNGDIKIPTDNLSIQ